MVIIKTLGQDTFSWNPNAFNRKGHWFLLAETGSYIRAATKEEMGKLGKPKKQDEVSITDSTEKKMSYKQASQIRKKSLKDLIQENENILDSTVINKYFDRMSNEDILGILK